MYGAGGGVIVNNASVLGWRAQKGQAHYAAAKAGVMALTRCAAMEAAEHGVRINAVALSIAMHPFLAKVTTDDAARRAHRPRGVRPGRRAVGGGQRDRVPRQRLLELHDRRDRQRRRLPQRAGSNASRAGRRCVGARWPLVDRAWAVARREDGRATRRSRDPMSHLRRGRTRRTRVGA